jgi:hypothetical protein
MKRLILSIAVMVCVTAFYVHADPIVIKADGKSIDDVVADIILDADKYDQKALEIRGAIYPEFGFTKYDGGFMDANPWFEDNAIVIFSQSREMRDQEFFFYFHPDNANREARKYVLSMTGKNYTEPSSLTSIVGVFVVYKIPYGPTLNLFLVKRLVLQGQTYEGTLPVSITK